MTRTMTPQEKKVYKAHMQKLSKKQRAEENRKHRTTWQINPVTRVVNKKGYNRQAFKRGLI